MHLQMTQGTLLSGPSPIIMAPAEIQKIKRTDKGEREKERRSAQICPQILAWDYV